MSDAAVVEQASLSPVLRMVLEGLGERVLSYHSQFGDDTISVAATDRLEVVRWLRETPELLMRRAWLCHISFFLHSGMSIYSLDVGILERFLFLDFRFFSGK